MHANLALCSAVIGALGSGNLADWLGRKKVIMIALAISFIGITMEFVATTNEVFFGGKFVNGFAIGALSSVTVTYIGEVRATKDTASAFDIFGY